MMPQQNELSSLVIRGDSNRRRFMLQAQLNGIWED